MKPRGTAAAAAASIPDAGWAVLAALITILCCLVAASEDTRPCTCELQGQIDDCCCGFSDIDRLNRLIEPLTGRLVQTTFFRFYRVDMDRKCRFWEDDEGKCGRQACTVEACRDEEVPRAVRSQESDGTLFRCTVMATGGLETGVSLGLLNDTITPLDKVAFATWKEHDDLLHDYCDIGDEVGWWSHSQREAPKYPHYIFPP